MRRRLRITYVGLLAAVLLGLAVPLAASLAAGASQEMFIDRVNDAGRFASLAEPVLGTGLVAPVEAELRAYDEMYGIAVAVVTRDGRVVLASRAGIDPTAADVQAPLRAALAGRHMGLLRTVWPWDTGPLVVAEPVGRGGAVVAAVVTVSPTASLRQRVAGSLLLLGGASLLALLAGAAAAGPLARWMLRPVERLDEAAGALSDGYFDNRVEVASGPPELRRLGASFNRMADRITTLVARQRSFVSYASHQLRTPLATLRLCVENLDTAVRPHGMDDYRTLAEEIPRLGELCDSLLVYARAEATALDGGHDADSDADDDADRDGDGAGRGEIDAAAIVARRIATWRQVADRAGLTLRQEGLDRAPTRAAAQALDQVLDALISNAVKFAGRGATVRVTVAGTEPSWVDIHVVDDGPGMSEPDLARAKEPFWRHSGDQNVDGFGLGVTIVDALVTASGGTFELLPARPHGIHAWIRLPGAPVAARR